MLRLGPADRFAVGVHDVSSANLAPTSRALEDLDRLGVRPRVLLVVPEELSLGGARARDLTSLLQREFEAGSEIVLHGFTHRAEGPPRGSWLTRSRARSVASGAAEFATIGETEMERRLSRGRALLAERGIRVAGFCPPAWLCGPGLGGAMRRAEFDYLVSMSALSQLGSGLRVWLPWYGHMGASGAHGLALRLGGEAMLGTVGRGCAVKVFMHPGSGYGTAEWDRTVAVINRLRDRRQPCTYAGLLALCGATLPHPGGGPLVRDPSPQ